ncbi:hypothetical protein ACFFPK_15050, partial [Glutamicibacter nicotianae]|uniref:hypothetical protein n=1 Tax=Glutamicibacter nicotianae TaxID=37929 RepID=UPI0035EA08F6
ATAVHGGGQQIALSVIAVIGLSQPHLLSLFRKCSESMRGEPQEGAVGYASHFDALPVRLRIERGCQRIFRLGHLPWALF